MTKTSDLVIKSLEKEGVKYVFGIPGEENLALLGSLKGSKIKLILTRHEQAAGFMAATYGRLTGTPGVCMSTLGPGATNFVTAAGYGALPITVGAYNRLTRRITASSATSASTPSLYRTFRTTSILILGVDRPTPAGRRRTS